MSGGPDDCGEREVAQRVVDPPSERQLVQGALDGMTRVDRAHGRGDRSGGSPHAVPGDGVVAVCLTNVSDNSGSRECQKCHVLFAAVSTTLVAAA